jgi:hypothetical protein
MSVALSQQDLSDLRAKGFSDQEIQQAMKEIEQEDLTGPYNKSRGAAANDPRKFSQQSSFVTKEQESLVKWQLELNDILERAEHILRGDVPTFENGHLIWKPNPKPQENVLNETGVKAVLKILAMYVNRNTILSDYENDEIRDKVFDFGRRVNNLMFMKAEEFGIDNEEKEKEKEVLIGELVDIVHSAYKRALKGGERRSLREMIQISQSSQQLGTGTNVNFNSPQQTRGLLNPMRYVKGKYV